VIPAPIAGYYGPIAAGPNGQYFLTDDQVLNLALTAVGTSTPARPIAAVTAVGANSYARFTTPVRASATVAPSDAGVVEIVDANTLRTTATASALESPLAAVTGTVRINVNGRTMALDSSIANAFVLTASGLSIVPLTPAAGVAAPQLSGTPLVNSANFAAAVAPGGLVSILGKNLAASASSPGTPLPTVLGGTCVTLNNVPIPLLATSPTQINAQVPFTLAAGRYPLVVRSIANLSASTTATVTVLRYAPAIFLDAQGPAILHHDGTRVNKDHPGSRDEPLTIYATGLGTTTGGKVTTGSPSPADPLAVTAPILLYFGNPTISDSGVIVDWSGLAPGMIGVYQISCRIPGTHLKGNALPVTLRIGGVSSPTTGSTAALVYVN
jgi:uncharacterized protein (TIGR03437 family)